MPRAEVVEPIRELSDRRAFVGVMIPVAGLRECDLEADVRLDQLRDLPERVAVAATADTRRRSPAGS